MQKRPEAKQFYKWMIENFHGKLRSSDLCGRVIAAITNSHRNSCHTEDFRQASSATAFFNVAVDPVVGITVILGIWFFWVADGPQGASDK